MIGKTLGHYEIIEPLGAGGMGEVYLGEDNRLGRKVAIKVLPAEFASDPERLARFEQEARAAAALNHPHIAVVHDIGTEGDTHFMVQEYLEGQSLRERLDKGALPLDKALDLATEVGEALVAAHKAGIIHRDLKPENIFVTEEGHAKVLDFGLAKLTEAAAPVGSELSMSPTMLGTVAGQVMGTAGYMAPEQARGAAEIDHRADLFAFGSVLYEMVGGKQAFSGRSVAEILAHIQHGDPAPLAEIVREPLPRDLHRILTKCLAKEAAGRYQHADDLVVDLRMLSVEAEVDSVQRSSSWIELEAAADGRHVVATRLALAATVVLIGITAFTTWMLTGSLFPSPAPIHLQMEVESGLRLWGGQDLDGSSERPSRTAIAISPDGQSIVYAATDGDVGRLFLRRLDAPSGIAIAGTEGGASPFFSPDGESVGFFAGGDLKRVPIGGGDARTILPDVPSAEGAHWADGDTIVFAGDDGIVRVSASGGIADRITQVRRDLGETGHAFPQLLSGGRAVLYTVERGVRSWQAAEIVLHPLDGEPTVLVRDGADGRYSPTGHLVFLRRGTLMAVAFDPAAPEAGGNEIPLVEGVMQSVNSTLTTRDIAAGQFGFSASGTLVYATGGVYEDPLYQVVWAGPEMRLPISNPRSTFPYPRLSPNDRRLALRSGNLGEGDIEVLELATNGLTQLRLDQGQGGAVWSPLGDRLAFSSMHESPVGNIYVIDADFRGEPERLTESNQPQYVSDWSSADVITFVQARGADGIWVLDLVNKGEPVPFVDAPGSQRWPAFSPDSKWLAYGSDEEGSFQVYVRPYPGRDPVYSVTRNGGTRPVWSRDGRRIYYRTGERDRSKMMVVDVTRAGASIGFSEPRELFDTPYVGSTPTRAYDVAGDGRFVMYESAAAQPNHVKRINIVLNWFEELKRLVPTER